MNTCKINVRFYEELNDHLPEKIRKKEIELEMPVDSTVQDILNKFGIPAREVHLVLVNGKNSLLNTKINARDLISIYPIFESIDIGPIKIIQ